MYSLNVCICPEPSNKQISHSRAGVTHMLIGIFLSLVKGAVHEKTVVGGHLNPYATCL